MQVSLTQIPQAGARRGGAAGSATQILRVCEAQTRGGKWPPACGAVSVRGGGDGLRGADTGRVPAAGGACVDVAEAPASRAEATRQGDSWERELRSPALPGSACAWASRQGPQARGRPPLVLLEASPWPKARWPRRTPPPAGLGGRLGQVAPPSRLAPVYPEGLRSAPQSLWFRSPRPGAGGGRREREPRPAHCVPIVALHKGAASLSLSFFTYAAELKVTEKVK